MKHSQLFKGSLTTIILNLLQVNAKMYGYEITEKVRALTQGQINITEGALYPALHKLEAEGLLAVEVLKVDGRLRKYYSLTKNGNKEAVNLLSELSEFITTMQTLVQLKPETK